MSKITVQVKVITTITTEIEVDAENYEQACKKINADWEDDSLVINTQMADEHSELQFMPSI
ncbi:hypothetical protein ACTXIV_08660 [Psychrobacter celer]|uniref:hypothetical protein n=1 Tax=Psychrobacter celer TaxID=306572 RepID=UPI003FCF031F